VTVKASALAHLHASELKGSRIIWRNMSLRAFMDAYEGEVWAFAQYRFECTRKAASSSRENAKQWRERKAAKEASTMKTATLEVAKDDRAKSETTEEGQKSHKARNLFEMPCLDPVKETAFVANSHRQNEVQSSDDVKVDDSSLQFVDAVRVELPHPCHVRKPRRRNIAIDVYFKNVRHRLTRSLPSYLAARQEQEWAKQSDEEKRQIKAKFFGLNVNEEKNPMVIAQKLAVALCDQGLKAFTEAERDAIDVVLQSHVGFGEIDFEKFYCCIVPQVRARLVLFNRAFLKELFQKYSSNSIVASVKACQAAVEHIARHRIRFLSSESLKHLGECFRFQIMDHGLASEDDSGDSSKQTMLRFNSFEWICQRTIERFVTERAKIFAELQKTWQHRVSDAVWDRLSPDVINFYSSFKEVDADSSGSLDMERLRIVLVEYGLLSGKRKDDAVVMNVVQECCDTAHGQFNFSDLLILVHRIREERQSQIHECKKTMFDHYDRDHNDELDMKEISTILDEMDLTPQDSAAQEEVKWLIDAADKDGDNRITMAEFEQLAVMVSEKSNAVKRFMELKVGSEFGFSPSCVREFRDCFWQLDDDGSGFLDIHELRKVMVLLKRDIDSDQLRQLFSVIDQDGSGALEFVEFLQLIHMLESGDEPQLPQDDFEKEGQQWGRTSQKEHADSSTNFLHKFAAS